MTSFPNLSSPFFLVQITEDLGDGAYAWVEAWRVSDGATVPTYGFAEKAGGRYGDATNPGHALDGASFAAEDYALCRSADGDGGLTWELLPLSAGGGSATITADVLAGTYTIAASGAWEDTGVEAVAPADGTYVIVAAANLSGLADVAAGMYARLVVAGVEAVVGRQRAGTGLSSHEATVPLSWAAQLSAGDAVKIQAWRDAGATWASSAVVSGAGNSTTFVQLVRIGG